MKDRIIKKIRYTYVDALSKYRKKPDSVLRWGIVGTGYMARTMARSIHANGESRVAAVCSRDINKAQSFSKNYRGARAYSDIDKMISDANLDVIYIATPTSTHYRFAMTALEAGQNVVCEKPITSSAEEFRRLDAEAKKNNSLLYEAMWLYTLPTLKRTEEWINEGRIGEVKLVRADIYKLLKSKHHTLNESSSFDSGALYDYGIYPIAFAQHIFNGSPISIDHRKRLNSDFEDTDWTIQLKFVTGNAFINISSQFKSKSVAAIIGSEGSIQFNSPFNRTNQIQLFDSKGELKKSFVARYQFEGFEYQVTKINQLLVNHKARNNKDTLEVQQTMEAVCKED